MAEPNPEQRQSIKEAVIAFIWRRDLRDLPWWQTALFQVLRILYVVIRDLGDGQLTLRAMSLVYTTLLSMVPLIAISFSVLKGFGAHNQVEPILFDFLAPLGPKGVEIGQRILEFVENMKVGVLGSLGLVLLLYTVISMMQKIERALNHAWRINEPRRLTRRFSDYLVVIMVGPVLIGASLSISATVMSANVVEQVKSIEYIDATFRLAGAVIPFILSAAAFTFIYIFIPNTKVRFTSALTGAVTATVMWKITGWVFASFIVTSSKYAAIYSAFASLIFFMIWLYMSWLILMVGAAVAFYYQHPEYLTEESEEARLSGRIREKLALLIMFAIGQNLYEAKSPWTADGLARRVKASMMATDRVLTALVGASILARTQEEPPQLVPLRPLDTLPILDVLRAVRSAEEIGRASGDNLVAERAVDDVQNAVETAFAEALSDRTVKDLVLMKTVTDADTPPSYTSASIPKLNNQGGSR